MRIQCCGDDFVHGLHNLFSGNVAVFTFGVLLFHPNPVCKTNIFSLEHFAHFLYIDDENGVSVADHLKVLTSYLCTCSFTVACADQGLVKFFSGANPSQLCSVEPREQHPVSVLSVAVMACG